MLSMEKFNPASVSWGTLEAIAKIVLDWEVFGNLKYSLLK